MNYIFNKKDHFYDYFPSLPLIRMKMDFGMDFFEQTLFKQQLQRVIVQVYKRLIDVHDLKHVAVYPKIGDEFDHQFYNELKQNVQLQMRNTNFWDLLDELMKNKDFESEEEMQNFLTRVVADIGIGISKYSHGNIKKIAFMALFNYDFDKLSGQEILYLSEIN